MTKLFFKNPIFMIWVAFCLTYLFFKPNMYIFYLLFMIMIPFKTQYICIHVFFTYGTFFNVVTHFFYQDSSIYDFNHILFYTMSGIFILLRTFLLKHDVDFL